MKNFIAQFKDVNTGKWNALLDKNYEPFIFNSKEEAFVKINNLGFKETKSLEIFPGSHFHIDSSGDFLCPFGKACDQKTATEWENKNKFLPIQGKMTENGWKKFENDKLKKEVFELANKLAIKGYGEYAVTLHQIHNNL